MTTVLVDPFFGDNIRDDVLKDQEKFFGSRNRILSDVVTARAEEIENDLEKIREQYSIPPLVEERDLVFIEYSFEYEGVGELVPEDRSRFLDMLPSSVHQHIFALLKQLLKKYALPPSYFDWLKYRLLYREPAPGEILWHWDYISVAIESPTTLKWLALTSGEKKFIKDGVRSRLGFKVGRVPDKHAALYKRITAALNESKNTKRTKKTLKQTLEIAVARQSGKTFAAIVGEREGSERLENEKKDIDKCKKQIKRLKKLKGGN